MNFESQIAAVRNLSTCHRFDAESYIISQYRVEEWSATTIHVHRVRVRKDRPSIRYSESFTVGPRGGVKEIYSTLYTDQPETEMEYTTRHVHSEDLQYYVDTMERGGWEFVGMSKINQNEVNANFQREV